MFAAVRHIHAKLSWLPTVTVILSLADCGFTQTWTQTSAPTNSWSAVAASADAKRLVAVAGDAFGSWPSGIYLSTNSGSTWFQTSAPSNGWTAVACSANGAKLFAAASRNTQRGPMYSSTNGGESWISNNLAPSQWRSVACSADGSKVFAETRFGALFTTTNSGALWVSNAAPGGTWAIACSPDGTTVLAGGGNLQTATCVSTNTGWTTNGLSGWRPWSVAMSADGKRMRAVDGGGLPDGLIYSSTNYGATWEAINSPHGVWQAIASSADGTKLIAAAHTSSGLAIGPLYTSVDSGLTWVSNNLPIKCWRSVACSADGSTFIAVTERRDLTSSDLGNGSIWISRTTPEPRLNLASSPNRLTLSWMTPTIDFRLWQSLHLSTNHWADVTNPPVLNLTNLNTEVFVPTPAVNTYYRLEAR